MALLHRFDDPTELKPSNSYTIKGGKPLVNYLLTEYPQGFPCRTRIFSGASLVQNEILKEQIADYIVNDDDQILIIHYPEGIVAAGYAASKTIVGQAVIGAGKWLLDRFLDSTIPELPEFDLNNSATQNSSSNYYGGQGNVARAGELLPMAYGKSRIYPDLMGDALPFFPQLQQRAYDLAVDSTATSTFQIQNFNGTPTPANEQVFFISKGETNTELLKTGEQTLLSEFSNELLDDSTFYPLVKRATKQAGELSDWRFSNNAALYPVALNATEYRPDWTMEFSSGRLSISATGQNALWLYHSFVGMSSNAIVTWVNYDSLGNAQIDTALAMIIDNDFKERLENYEQLVADNGADNVDLSINFKLPYFSATITGQGPTGIDVVDFDIFDYVNFQELSINNNVFPVGSGFSVVQEINSVGTFSGNVRSANGEIEDTEIDGFEIQSAIDYRAASSKQGLFVNLQYPNGIAFIDAETSGSLIENSILDPNIDELSKLDIDRLYGGSNPLLTTPETFNYFLTEGQPAYLTRDSLSTPKRDTNLTESELISFFESIYFPSDRIGGFLDEYGPWSGTSEIGSTTLQKTSTASFTERSYRSFTSIFPDTIPQVTSTISIYYGDAVPIGDGVFHNLGFTAPKSVIQARVVQTVAFECLNRYTITTTTVPSTGSPYIMTSDVVAPVYTSPAIAILQILVDGAIVSELPMAKNKDQFAWWAMDTVTSYQLCHADQSGFPVSGTNCIDIGTSSEPYYGGSNASVVVNVVRNGSALTFTAFSEFRGELFELAYTVDTGESGNVAALNYTPEAGAVASGLLIVDVDQLQSSFSLIDGINDIDENTGQPINGGLYSPKRVLTGGLEIQYKIDYFSVDNLGNKTPISGTPVDVSIFTNNQNDSFNTFFCEPDSLPDRSSWGIEVTRADAPLLTIDSPKEYTASITGYSADFLTGQEITNQTDSVIWLRYDQAGNQSPLVNFDQFNLIGSRLVDEFNFSTGLFTGQKITSSNPADIFMHHACKEIGIAIDDIDWPALADLAANSSDINGNKVEFNYVFSNKNQDIEEDLAQIMRAARRVLFKVGKKYYFGLDYFQPEIKSIISGRNADLNSFTKSFSFESELDYDAIEAVFKDEDAGYKAARIIAKRTGATPNNPKKIDLQGITRKDSAIYAAAYLFLKEKWVKKTASISMTREALIFGVYDRIKCIDPTQFEAAYFTDQFPDQKPGIDAEIWSFDQAEDYIQISQLVEPGTGGITRALVQYTDGTVNDFPAVPVNQNPFQWQLIGIDYTKLVAVGDALGGQGNAQIGSKVIFYVDGIGGDYSYSAYDDYLVTAIEPQDEFSVKLELIEYNPDIYHAYDDGIEGQPDGAYAGIEVNYEL